MGSRQLGVGDREVIKFTEWQVKVESRIRRGKDDGWGDLGGGFDDKDERCYMSIFEEIKGDWIVVWLGEKVAIEEGIELYRIVHVDIIEVDGERSWLG